MLFKYFDKVPKFCGMLKLMSMKKFLITLSAVIMAIASIAPVAAQQRPKIAENSFAPQIISKVRQRDNTVMPSQSLLVKKLLKDSEPIQCDARFTSPQKTLPTVYDAGVDIPKIFGWVNYSDSWYNFESKSGVYYIPTNNTESYQLRFLNDNTALSGVLKDGIYYCCYALSFGSTTWIYYEGYDLATVDPNNATDVRYYYSIPSAATSMTLDDATGQIFAIANTPGTPGQFLATLELRETKDDFELTKIGDLPGIWKTIVCDRSGQLYGIKCETKPGTSYDIVTKSELYKIDKNTAQVTLIGDTGVLPQFESDAVIDLNSGRMFWVVCPEQETSYIAEVNLTTGLATPLYTLPDDAVIKGLAIGAPEAYDKAPAAVTDAAVHFKEGNLTGSVSFKAPTTCFDNTPAPVGSELTAVVRANGEIIATNKVMFGQQVEMAIEVLSPGMYNFDITVENAEGISPKVTLENVFVGNGTPKAPEPVLTSDNGVMTLTWQAVTESAEGGYVNPAEVTYTVVRYPDNVTVADAINQTSFTETLARPETVVSYYYTVTVNFAGKSSVAVESNHVLLGSMATPFVADFEKDMNLFTVVDCNNDGRTWGRQEAFASSRPGYYVRINTYVDLDVDDWLITPPIHFEGGKAYKLNFDVVTSNENDEVLEIKMGKGLEISGLTTTLLEPTTMRYGASGKIETCIIIDETGDYTIGFHALSKAGSFYIAVDDISVSASIAIDIPAKIDNLKAEAGAMGALNATLSLTAPSLSINGAKLTSLDAIELYRGETLIHTFSSPSCGDSLSYVDNVDKEGTYSYSAVAVNAAGRSDVVSTEVFIGTGIPKSPENVKFTRTDIDGEALLTWDAVAENVHNQSINPDDVKYDIYTTDGYQSTELAKGISGTSYKHQAAAEGEQVFMQYIVTPYTASGQGLSAMSNLDVVGTPYESIYESGNLNGVFSTTGSGAMWVRTSTDELGILAQDNDSRVFALSGQYEGGSGVLTTGMVSLKNMSKPGLSFYIFSMGESDTNNLKVYVIDAATGEKKIISDIVLNTLPEYHNWNKVMIPLDEYAGKTVLISFEGHLQSFTWLLIDDIRVNTLLDNDLAASLLQAPSHVAAGSKYNVAVTVRNEGMKMVSDYRVQIISGSEVLASCDGTPIESNTKANLDLELSMDVFAAEPLEIYASIVYDVDQDTKNNSCSPVVIELKFSHLPAPSNLSAAKDDNNIVLTWTAPDYEAGVPMQVTETFETAKSWAHEFGTWQFIDLDQSEVGAITGFTTPGIDYAIDKSSFYVFDASIETADETFFTHSGSKMLASLFRWDNKAVDDWAVSPLLDKSAQTVSFYARSYDQDYPETIEVYYTTSDNTEFDRNDYEKCATFTNLTEKFSEFIADVPAGTTHFAIRSCATGAYLLLVDDVSYYPQGSYTKTNFLGYDVYRDGKKINDNPVHETTFVDNNVEADVTYKYVVVALYDLGASSPSNVESIQFTGLDELLETGLIVSADHENIIVKGAENQHISICSIDGKTFYSSIAPDLLVVPVPQGIYLVKSETARVKVVVR